MMKKHKGLFLIIVTVFCLCTVGVAAGCAQNDEINHVHKYTESITLPTCTEAGYTTYKCLCGESYKDNYVSAKGHAPQEACRENEVEATCMRSGSYDEVVRCSVCNEIITSTPHTTNKIPHNYVDGICSKCGDDITQSHVHSYTNQVILPTCKDKGYTTHTCACGDSFIDNYVDKTNVHTPKSAVHENEVKATCTQEGSYIEVVRCSVCNEVISSTPKTIDKIAHTPKSAVHENEVKATCTQEGSYDEVVRCSICNEVISSTPKTIDKIAHTPKSAVHENEVKATCTQEGSYDEVVRCSICNEVISSIPKTIDKIAHTPKSAVRENEVKATCTQEGSYDEVVRCSICNDVISLTPKTIDKLAHTPKEAARENIVEATWEQDGSYDLVVRCNVCNAVLSSEHFTEKKKPVGTEIHSNTLTLDGDTLYGKLPNGTEIFRFAGDITVADGARYYLCSDITGTQVIPTKIAPLQTGDNTYYLVVENGNADPMTYTVTLRVRPLYTVTFDTGNGTHIESQTIEEDGIAMQPDILPKWLGYNFTGWTYDFTKPILQDTVVQAFTVSAEMQNFTFTSDEETCVITGILDKTATEIVVPNYVTEIVEGAFNGCASLESITLPFVGDSRKTSSQTYQYPLGYIFGRSSYTASVETQQCYYGSSTSSTTNTTYYIPSSLKSVMVTGGDILCGAFYNCSLLTSITTGDSVTSVGRYAFFGCRQLESITIGNGVTNIGYNAFHSCKSLKAVYITDIAAWCNIEFVREYTSVADNVSNPLFYANKLYVNGELITDLVIPDGVTSIGKYAFWGCSSLKSITIPDSVANIGAYAFFRFRGLNNITIPNSVTSIGEYAFSECSSLTSITLLSKMTSIGEYAFKGCSSLISITIPNGETSIGWNAFSGCSSLTSITLPSKMTRIGWNAFSGCSSLISITIPNGVTCIESSAFSGCSSLTSITLPNSVTSIESSAFEGCSSLTSITLPNSVTSIASSAFEGCSSLTSITLPNRVKTIGSSAFEGCSSLTSITIPNNVTSIGGYAFSGCSSLTSITLPNSVTSIGSSAFKGCSSLTSITLPNSVKSIESSAFKGCSSLTSITLPNSVTTIKSSAFEGCNKLSRVYYGGKAEDWKISINSYNTSFTGATRYYYSKSEPELNEEGTAYNGNYWYRGENGEVKVWLYVEDSNEVE